MPMYQVKLSRTTTETTEVEIEAKDENDLDVKLQEITEQRGQHRFTADNYDWDLEDEVLEVDDYEKESDEAEREF